METISGGVKRNKHLAEKTYRHTASSFEIVFKYCAFCSFYHNLILFGVLCLLLPKSTLPNYNENLLLHNPDGLTKTVYSKPKVQFLPGTDPEIIRAFELGDIDGSGAIDAGELGRVLSSGLPFSTRTVNLMLHLYSGHGANKIGLWKGGWPKVKDVVMGPRWWKWLQETISSNGQKKAVCHLCGDP
ncbi:unnamed protein product [Calypogeia fissa]